MGHVKILWLVNMCHICMTNMDQKKIHFNVQQIHHRGPFCGQWCFSENSLSFTSRVNFWDYEQIWIRVIEPFQGCSFIISDILLKFSSPEEGIVFLIDLAYGLLACVILVNLYISLLPKFIGRIILVILIGLLVLLLWFGIVTCIFFLWIQKKKGRRHESM